MADNRVEPERGRPEMKWYLREAPGVEAWDIGKAPAKPASAVFAALQFAWLSIQLKREKDSYL